LKHTCGLVILRLYQYKWFTKRLAERLSIIQFLKERDLGDKELYDTEIKYISNILVIQKRPL
jgi:hypothetical protein